MDETLTLRSVRVQEILRDWLVIHAMSEAQFSAWINSQIVGGGDYLKSEPPAGNRKVKNLYVNANGKLIVQFDDQPV